MLYREGIFLVLLTWFHCNYAVEVSIDQGTLVGSTFLSRNGRQYYGFLSIPFARPPVRELRFEPPQPPNPWNGLRNATQPPPVCTQKDAFTWYGETSDVEGDEDCLYLNVYTPAQSNSSHLLPVMVWIHGGAFIDGSSNMYDPVYFMDLDIVVVTIQYRLNILGFLSTVDHVLPGNNGMKDQVMALKWIQKNIAAFGGNPGQVTIAGGSSGGASVHLHMHSPLSKGLFHRAICQSGSALAPWVHISSKLARERAFTLGTLTGCHTKNSQKLVDCLKKVPARELVLAHNKFYLFTDGVFAGDVLETSKRRSNSTVPTFFYYYDHRNENSAIIDIGIVEKDLGVCHQDERVSLFHLKGVVPMITKGNDLKVSERMVKYWVNFVTTGNPDPNAVWTTVKSDAIEYLHIQTDKDEMKTGLLEERYQFWKSLSIMPPQESSTLFHVVDEL